MVLPVAGTLDESAQITNRQVEWEVDGSQELHEEQIPAEQADDESYRTCCGEKRSVGAVTEEERSQAAEGRNQEEEDEEEDDVRSDRDNTVDEAEDAHVHLEEAK